MKEEDVQSPRQIAVQILVHTLHVLQRHLLPQHHLIERPDKEGIQETTVENGQPHHTSDELEVVQMLRVDARVRVDLQGIIIVGRVLEQTVEGVEHFMRKKEEEFTARVSLKTFKWKQREIYRERPP